MERKNGREKKEKKKEMRENKERKNEFDPFFPSIITVRRKSQPTIALFSLTAS